jgi:hypothetical protein
MVEFGCGGAPVASSTVAWMMAMVAGWGLWQAERKREKKESKSRGRMDVGTFAL